MAIKKEFESAKNWYLDSFENFSNSLNGQRETFYNKVRNEAIEKLKVVDFPTLKNEEWKYTNVSPIMKSNFVPSNILSEIKIDQETIQEKLFTDFDHHLMVFVNGVFNSELSKIDELPGGVIVDSFNDVLRNQAELIEPYIKKYSKSITAFDSLNAAYAIDGLVAIVPDGKIVEKPIQVLYLNGRDDEQVLSSPRNLIVAGKNAQVSIIANYVGNSDNPYFSNITTEVVADENAIVDLYKVQNESNSAYHIERVEAHQSKQSIFSHYNISFGGKIVRNDINSEMSDEFIETNYFGLYLGCEDQHVDNHTLVDHAKPNCESNELYKGILDDQSRGVFNGKIMVRQDAQKTNAYQSNKTVLLSKDATIDTKPQLEIYADDVKCSHGATVGHLDDTAYFYIRSRGVPSEIAKSMLIRAFANDVIEKIKIEPLKEQLNHLIFEHLHRVEI
jgi:Fe-S cluster assembly protein SufD